MAGEQLTLLEQLDCAIEQVSLLEPVLKLQNPKKGVPTKAVDLQDAVKAARAKMTLPLPLLVKLMDKLVSITVSDISLLSLKDKDSAWDGLMKDRVCLAIQHAVLWRCVLLSSVMLPCSI